MHAHEATDDLVDDRGPRLVPAGLVGEGDPGPDDRSPAERGAGDELLSIGSASDEDKARLRDHVAGGCPSCAPRFAQEEELEGLIARAMQPLETESESRRRPVLSGRIE